MEKSKKPLEYLGHSRMVKKLEIIPAENNLLDKRQHLLEYETTAEPMTAAFL